MTSPGTDDSSELFIRAQNVTPSHQVPTGRYQCQRKAFFHHMDESLRKGHFPQIYLSSLLPIISTLYLPTLALFDLEDAKLFFDDPLSLFPKWGGKLVILKKILWSISQQTLKFAISNSYSTRTIVQAKQPWTSYHTPVTFGFLTYERSIIIR